MKEILRIPGLCFLVIILLAGSCRDKPKLTIGFTPDRREAKVDDSIMFTNTSTGYTAFLWDFGDSTTSVELKPKHAYKNAGTYFAVLKVINSKDSAETNLKIEIYPKISIVVNDTSLVTGRMITFSQTGTTPVLWKLNDSVLNESLEIAYKFSLPGSYKVEITDPLNKTLIDSRELIIRTWRDTTHIQPPPPPPPPPLTPTFALWPVNCIQGEKIGFRTDYPGKVVWDFGGLDASKSKIGQVAFDNPGKYTVTLKNDSTGSLLKSWSVTINERIDDAKFSEWLTKLANDLPANEQSDLIKKIYSNCTQSGNIQITGWQDGTRFKDFVEKITMTATQFEQATVQVNITVSAAKKVETVNLVLYNRKR